MRRLALLIALALSPVLASAQSPATADSLRGVARQELVRSRAFVRAAETQLTKTLAALDSADAAAGTLGVDTVAVLRAACMEIPYATRDDLLADTVVVATPDTAAAANQWCLYGYVRDSATVAPADGAPAPLRLAGMVGSALLGTVAVGAALAIPKRRG